MVTEKEFGVLNGGETVREFTIANKNGMRASVFTLGCTLTSVVLPTANGETDVCLGYDTPQEYIDKHTSMGAVCGRFANRIEKGQFTLNGTTYQLAVNNGPNHLHGGKVGFAYRIWDAEIADDHSVTFSRLSPDGEENYPGNLRVRVTYSLTDDDCLTLRYEAVSDADTILNLTNHSYWNLNGHASGDATGHTLRLPCSFFCPTDSHSLVTGEIRSVEDTPFDFRAAKAIGRDIDSDDEQLAFGAGYDHCFLLNDAEEPIVLTGDRSGISMEIATDMPGVQLYTANHLREQNGKNGSAYFPRCSVCLETQQIPDAPNKPQFPSAVLKANEPFESATAHRFRY